MIKKPLAIQKSNTLEGAFAIKIAFEDQRIIIVEKIDQMDLLVILNKPTLISHIEFVIPDEFKDVKINIFLFTKMIKELVQVSMVQILMLFHFKIQGRVFSNWCVQASISLSLNLEDKIHLKEEGNVMT